MPSPIHAVLPAVALAAAGFLAPCPQDPGQDPPVEAPAEDIAAVYETFTSDVHWRETKAAGEKLVTFGDRALDLVRRGAEHHEDEQVRRRCYDLLVRHWPTEPRAVRTIENDGLADASGTIRYMCAFHLGQHKLYASFRRLEHVLNDPEEEELTRYAAAKSLAELGEADGLPLLYDGLGSDWYMPRYMSNLGFKALTGKDLDDFDYDFSEGAFVSGGVEARSPRRPIEDAERRARRFQAIAAYCRWLRDEHPELYKHIAGAW